MQLEHFVYTLVNHDANGYLVGGAVRDTFMGIPAHDRDYCVTGMSQQTFESLFPSAELQGKDFPVYRMEIDGEFCEVALARTERKVSEGHKGFQIEASPSVTIEEDLARRDFTMNAMAIELETNRLIDPFFGCFDIKDKLISATSIAFTEDPLRVYRAARFAAEHDFFIAHDTVLLMKILKDELRTLPIERVRAETEKALLSGKPSQFFRYLKQAQVLDVHFPEIDCLTKYEQNPNFHPEGNVFEHTMQVLDSAALFRSHLPVENDKVVMYASLLHDVGKAVTAEMNPKTGYPTHRGHEEAGVPIAESFLNRFHIQSDKKAILYIVSKHMVMHDTFTATSTSKAVDFMHGKFAYSGQEYIRKTGLTQAVNLYDYLAVCMADVTGRIQHSNEVEKSVAAAVFVDEKVSSLQTFNIDELLDLISTFIRSEERAIGFAHQLLILSKHKMIMEVYLTFADDVTYSKDLEGAKEKYTGERLGYEIHNEKRSQRTPIMSDARKLLNLYMAECRLF